MKSQLNITKKEELDYDNKRLVYVNDLSGQNTHDYENNINLSTDDVVSLFDGGYQLGLIEQIEFYERNSDDNYENLLEILNTLKEKYFQQNLSDNELNQIVFSIKNLFENHQTEVCTNLVKRFETSRYSNEKRVRDKNISVRMIDFYDHLLRTHRTTL
jgi:hypothetical protein